MKCQSLFPERNKKNITNVSSAALAQRVVMAELYSLQNETKLDTLCIHVLEKTLCLHNLCII